MGRAWDDAVDREFAKRVQRIVAQTMEDCDAEDPYRIAEEIGRVLLDEIDTTYGLPQRGAANQD